MLATVIGGFATLTMLTKNSFLDEIRKQYVTTARAKGLDEKNPLPPRVPQRHAAGDRRFSGHLYQHVLHRLAADRSHVLAQRPGLLGYDATLQRDYPVMFGTLYIFTLIGLLLNILSDITYTGRSAH